MQIIICGSITVADEILDIKSKLEKKIYCLYEIPEMQYKSEILATRPEVLNGDLELIENEVK